MKKLIAIKSILIVIFVLLMSTISNAQTGLNFQGVARSSNNVIIASQQISLRLSILQGSATGSVEYSETRKVTTNAQGLFAVVIGDADATSAVGSFNTINWKNTPKYLKIEMDASAGNNFSTIGTTQFQYVAYAQFAKSVDAENIAGIVPVNKGGTGVSSITALKTALSLDKINNTSDADKPISTKTQTALDLKLNAADTSKYTKQSYTDAALLTKFNLADTGKYTKQVFTDSSLITKLKLSDTASMLSNRIGKDTLNLSARINAKANTSDVNTILALKANTIDINTSLGLKANASDVTASLSNKVDKVTGKELSTNDYSNAEKAKLAAITGTNTGDQDLSSYATNTALALKANTADVNTALALKANASDVATSLLSKLNKTDTSYLLQKADTATLSNRINLKANATDVTTGLSSKVDKVNGKELSTNDYTTLEKSKLAAITGANTGDETEASIKSKLGIAVFFSGAYSDLTDKPDLTLKENLGNKTIDFITDAESDIKYPTVKAVKAYVDAANATLLNGVVSLTTDQTIEGKKTFKNDLIMGTMGGGVGTTTPTTINFANGSKIGDIQNIFEGNPTNGGSIDLYAPDAAKWVQLNYGNTNYITLDDNGAYFYIGDLEWNFLKMGTTELPGNLNFKNDNGNSEINSDNELDITSKNDVRLRHWDGDSYTRWGLFENEASLLIENGVESKEWTYNVDGSSWFPGDLNFTDNHAINFLSAGTSTSIANSSISSAGPNIKIKARDITETEYNDDIDYGVELNYADRNYFRVADGMYFYNQDISSNNYWSGVDFNYNNFNFSINNNGSQYDWNFTEDGATVLPGKLEVAGTLKLGTILFPNVSGTSGDVLTADASGNAIWRAPTGGAGISIINGVSSGTHSFTSSNSGTDFSIQSDANTGIHTFNLPDASASKRGLLNSADYATFYAKQNALTNPLTGTGTSGQLSFFNGTSTVTSSSDLFWDATNKRLGIGNQSPGYPVEINTGNANYGLMISSESSNSWGSGIGFKSSTDATTKTGLFQLDRDGAMVFRTLQDNMYFDNSGAGSIKFRMGNPSANIGMSLNNSGDLEIKGTLKAGAVLYPNVSGTLGDVLTADASGNPIWQAPTVTSVSDNVDASTLSGTTLKSTVINSSLTSLGTLANLTVTNPINGSITGNAATVTTNANLTGVVTSVGNITSIATGTISNSMLANTAVANLSGVNTGDNAVNARYSYLITDVANLLAANTGDNAINSRYNSLVTNAVHYGDIKPLMTGSDGYNVIGINGTRLLDLQTGILKNTTGTGVPSIAVASDFPTLNQSTTGNAATATKFFTSRKINEVAFDGTEDITISSNAGTLTGTTLNSTVINSSLTSVGTLLNLTVTNPIDGSINGNAASATTATTAGTASAATKLATARNINGVPFDGSAAITVTADASTLTGTTLKSTITNSSLTSVGTLVNLSVTNPISGSVTGNAATATLASSATKLATSRNINGIAFDGTGDITVAANAGTLTGTSLNTTITGSSLTSVGVLNNATVNGKVIVGAAAESSSSAILEASSTTQGFLPPRMTIAQRLAIVSPAQGLMIYCTNCGTYGEPQYYNGNAWLNFAGTASSKGTPTINITVGTYTYTGSAQGPATATNTGTGSTYSFTYVGTGSTTYASSSTRPTNAGTYSVTASLSASSDGNYNAATASAAFTIAQAIPTVTPTIGTYNYISGTPQGPTAATNTGTGTNYIYSYTGTGITTYGPSATKPTDGGTYNVIATVAANGNYAAASSAPTAFSIKTNLAVGNTYGGGKVAYILRTGDIGYDANQQHGLIVSGDLTIPDINWGTKYVVTGASGGVPDNNGIYPPADLETGMSNTNIIINSEGPGTNYAAGLAKSYTGGGYTNWYLPSASQMNAMKAYLNAISTFTKVHYWTSTEDDYYYSAYTLYATSSPSIESIDKINTQVGVRAVRSF